MLYCVRLTNILVWCNHSIPLWVYWNNCQIFTVKVTVIIFTVYTIPNVSNKVNTQTYLYNVHLLKVVVRFIWSPFALTCGRQSECGRKSVNETNLNANTILKVEVMTMNTASQLWSWGWIKHCIYTWSLHIKKICYFLNLEVYHCLNK